MTGDPTSRAAAIAAAVGALPALDPAVGRLARLLQDDDATAADFAAVIRPDPALTANLLRCANAAAFRGRAPVVDVREAVVRVGVRRVWEIAAAGAFGRALPERLDGYAISAAGFKRHSVAVAVLAQRLAARSRRPVADAAWVAGLLHDLGKLVVAAFLADRGEDLRARLDADTFALVDAERDLLGTDHAEVGAAVAERWRLPPEIGAAARWHHAPGGAPPGRPAALAAVVHVADGLAHALGFGADVGDLHRRVAPDVLAGLGLAPEAVDAVACEALAEIADTARLLDR